MKQIVLILALFIGLSSSSQNKSLEAFFTVSNAFFNTYVEDGKVAYDLLYKDSTKLDKVLGLAKSVSVSKDEVMTYQAFWINAYNLSVIKGVINNYPTKSPLDNAGFFDKVEYDLAGVKITLNDIEHKLLRGQFNDPRFHFVLVCGAVGCPPLISKAYLPKTLYMQLEAQTKVALNGSFLMVDLKKKRVAVSQIMEWYKEDFRMNGMTEIDFINQYRKEKIPNKFKLKYFPYDWKLNAQ